MPPITPGLIQAQEKKGLTQAQASKILQAHGKNTLPKHKQKYLPLIFVKQFLSPLIYILIASATVAMFLAEYSDAGFIIAVILINASIGAGLEFSAEKSAAALQSMLKFKAWVLRNNKKININAENIVPKDHLFLQSGERIPADAKLTTAHNLSIDESMLTGESIAVEKIQNDTVYAGTFILRGRAEATVTATAKDSQLGQIAQHVNAPSSIKPPLLLRIEKFTWMLSLAVTALIAIIFITAILKGGNPIQVFSLAVALAVAAIPEGLPAAITITLALGMRKMAKSNVIVRRLLTVEALGSCTFIASDKTGTLTINQLSVRKIITPNGKIFDLNQNEIITQSNNNNHLKYITQAAIFANEATLQNKKPKGDSVDVALWLMALMENKKCQTLLKKFPTQSQIPYESQQAFSASIQKWTTKYRIFAKGSPEKISQLCPNDNSKEIIKQANNLAQQGYRIIALAWNQCNTKNINQEIHNGLKFAGLIAMIDPLRSEAKQAVSLCHSAGIKVAMITGDHPKTALNIAADLGLCSHNQNNVITGTQIENAAKKNKTTLDKLIAKGTVFARIKPLQKKLIVESLQRLKHYVAVTGDGVNDAPALKEAHVGVAMGKNGSDVAKQSADLIITDDDFSSIVKGIRQGRTIYANIRKVIFFLLSTGAAEIVLFIWAIIFSSPIPLFASQLLWLNLVTSGVQDIALACEPQEGDELNKPPRNPQEPIFNKIMLSRIISGATSIGTLAFATFILLLKFGYTEDKARNVLLMLMLACENIQAFNARSENKSILKMKFLTNIWLPIAVAISQIIHISAIYTPKLNTILHLQPISTTEWITVTAIALAILITSETEKFIRQKLT